MLGVDCNGEVAVVVVAVVVWLLLSLFTPHQDVMSAINNVNGALAGDVLRACVSSLVWLLLRALKYPTWCCQCWVVLGIGDAWTVWGSRCLPSSSG